MSGNIQVVPGIVSCLPSQFVRVGKAAKNDLPGDSLESLHESSLKKHGRSSLGGGGGDTSRVQPPGAEVPSRSRSTHGEKTVTAGLGDCVTVLGDCDCAG